MRVRYAVAAWTVMMASFAAPAKAGCSDRTITIREFYCPVSYRWLKPQMDRINFAIVPIEKAMDSCDFPPSLMKQMLTLDGDVQQVGMEMIARELPPRTMQRHLDRTCRELQRVWLKVVCYQAYHPPQCGCYAVVPSIASRRE